MSWPIPGTLMVEPTECESLDEMERFCEAMRRIRAEIARVERGEWPRDNNPLVNAPHSLVALMAETWDRPYSRHEAAFPMADLVRRKIWPSVGRVDDVYGDVHLETAVKT